MSQTADPRVRWTTTYLKLLPGSSNRYEIIDGDLLVTRAPHWGHQKAITNTAAALRDCSDATGLGKTVSTPGVIFTDVDNVIPDVVWISKARHFLKAHRQIVGVSSDNLNRASGL